MNSEMDRTVPPAEPEKEIPAEPEKEIPAEPEQHDREPDSSTEKQASVLEDNKPEETEPAVSPAPETAEQHPRRRRRPVHPEEDDAPEAGSKEEPEKSGMPEEFYPLDRCCICNHPLDTGCAIMFTDEHGMARIDEICCKSLEVAARSTDKAEVARAFDYFAAWVPYAKPPVAEYLRNYLRVVQTFLNA